MVWERQQAYIPEAPEPPQAKSWFVAIIIAIIFCMLLFVLHASGRLYFLQQINIWIVSIFPLIGWVIAFCIRSYLFGRTLSEYHFLLNEAQTAQNQWQDWAERYMAVIAHTILLPDKITAPFLANDPKDFPPQYSLTKRINYLPEHEESEFPEISVLLNSIASALNALPAELLLKVTLLSDADEKAQYRQQVEFLDGWNRVSKKRADPEIITSKASLPYDVIDTRLKGTDSTAELLVILQQQGQERYSDALGIYLFTTDDVAQKYRIPVKGRLLRPMRTELKSLQPDLTLFMETQLLSQKAHGVLGDSVGFLSLTSQFLPVAATFNSSLTTESIMVQERFTGIPGPFSSWIAAGLGLDLALHYSLPYLVFARADQGWFISTVSSGNHNDIV